MDMIGDISKALKGLLLVETKVDKAVKTATQKVGADASRLMKKQIVGGHSYGTTRAEGEGIEPGKPSNVTGDLRRSIRSTIKGFANQYVATVGPYMIYSRALEFGNPRWRSGVKYPFVAPTATLMSENNRARGIYQKALHEALSK